MLDEIKLLISKKDYTKALELIEKRLEELPKSEDDSVIHEREDLLQQRVHIHYLNGTVDDVIFHAIRQEVFIKPREFTIADGQKIILAYQNLFSIPCDAYVNSIHLNSLFESPSPASATYNFVMNAGPDLIRKQMPKGKKYKIGDVIHLNHDHTMSAPESYHIICHAGDADIDLDGLENGMRHILNEARKLKLKCLGFPALGFNILGSLPEDMRAGAAEEMSERVIRTLVEFVLEHRNEQLPEFVFGFVNPSTWGLYQGIVRQAVNSSYRQFIEASNQREKDLLDRINTRNPDYLQSLRKLSHFADDNVPILITGETGVGKSMLAESLHGISSRNNLPFVQMNCALVPKDLVYTQLFGAERGSYTGSNNLQKGLIEQAGNGTIFLDEIGDAEEAVQKGLLTFLDHGKYRRLGGTELLTSKAKIIFGTNKKLGDEVRKGLFRADLLERIEKRVVEIPALRNRPEDITVLVAHIMRLINENREPQIDIDDGALKELTRFNWPGNIRQLITYIERRVDDVVFSNKTTITKNVILSDPPRNELYRQDDDVVSRLEGLIVELIQKLEAHPDIQLNVKEIWQSIGSKVYLDDLRMPVTKASKILGMEGSGGENSTLKKKAANYSNIKSILTSL